MKTNALTITPGKPGHISVTLDMSTDSDSSLRLQVQLPAKSGSRTIQETEREVLVVVHQALTSILKASSPGT